MGGHLDSQESGERDLKPATHRATVPLLAGLLRRWHFTNVVAITDPTLVVDEFADLTPDLLLLDINMPVLDGFALMGLLERWTHGTTPVPILVLTAGWSR
jgi:CheY-like chemotaxis protein